MRPKVKAVRAAFLKILPLEMGIFLSTWRRLADVFQLLGQAKWGAKTGPEQSKPGERTFFVFINIYPNKDNDDNSNDSSNYATSDSASRSRGVIANSTWENFECCRSHYATLSDVRRVGEGAVG